MAIICETSAILNGCDTAIKPIEVAACDDTCFFLGGEIQRANKTINNQFATFHKSLRLRSKKSMSLRCSLIPFVWHSLNAPKYFYCISNWFVH